VKARSWVLEVPGTLAGRSPEELHLMGTRCERCGRIFFPTRKNCPRCLDDQFTKELTLSDEGILQTYSIASIAPPGYSIPHAQGYIDICGGGPRIFSLLTDYGDGSSLSIGCRMIMKAIRVGRDKDDRAILGYRFRPVA
jgi:uncharacterized OB-fold protein